MKENLSFKTNRNSTDDKNLGLWIIYMFLLPLFLFIRGWSLKTVWNWFVAPLGVKQINTWDGIGLSIFISLVLLFLWRENLEERNPETQLTKSFTYVFISIFLVGFGWLVIRLSN